MSVVAGGEQLGDAGAGRRMRDTDPAEGAGNLDFDRLAAERRAQELGIPFIDLRVRDLDRQLLAEMPIELMVRHAFVPLARDTDGTLDVVLADPGDLANIDAIEGLLDVPIRVHAAAPGEIEQALHGAGAGERILERVRRGFEEQVEAEGVEEEGITLARLATEEGPPIVRLLDTTILNGLERRASDIHIETRDEAVWIKYRIDGVLYPAVEPIDLRHHDAIISRIKVMSDLDIAEKRVPQDGRFKLNLHSRKVDFRVSIMPSIHGEDAVIRILDKQYLAEEFADLRLERLGFAGAELQKIRKYIREPYGMFLVTGPTGSGKTTTLYAALSEIRSEEDKIITIEDPVEYQISGITQIPVNEKKGLTFARGLRSILRHDPDIIMVGEIRDSETAHIGVQSALTGHLVFTTVHANNVVDVIGRLLNMGVEPYNFVSALNCVLAQRLVRMICPHCKRLAEIDDALLAESGLRREEIASTILYEGAGCEACHGTGYVGRTAIAELLDMSDRIREMILERRPASEIKRQAAEEGMSFLRQSALQKVFAGQTTLQEINKVTFVE
ncbi:MAG: GspE/PulE family protein [Acidobacteriota bacterium]